VFLRALRVSVAGCGQQEEKGRPQHGVQPKGFGGGEKGQVKPCESGNPARNPGRETAAGERVPQSGGQRREETPNQHEHPLGGLKSGAAGNPHPQGGEHRSQRHPVAVRGMRQPVGVVEVVPQNLLVEALPLRQRLLY